MATNELDHAVATALAQGGELIPFASAAPDHLATVRSALALADKATPGPYTASYYNPQVMGADGLRVAWIGTDGPGDRESRGSDRVQLRANAASIAALRNATPAIAAVCDEMDRLRGRITELESRHSPKFDGEPDRCPKCEWTNGGLINYGGATGWLCHGCASRRFAEVEAHVAMLGRSRPAKRVLVHADGGDCHGSRVVNGRCVKCGIAPDMQSTEQWPEAEAAAPSPVPAASAAFLCRIADAERSLSAAPWPISTAAPSNTPEIVGQLDPVLLDAARRAGEVLAELARVESAIETVVAQIDRGRRGQLAGVVTRLGELRAKLRPVAALDIDARERAAADLRETDERAAVADRKAIICALGIEAAFIGAPTPDHAPVPAQRGAVDAVLWAVAQCHDGSDLWAHMKRDPGTFRNAIDSIMAADRERAIRDHDATWRANDLERDAEVARWQGEAHALVRAVKSIAAAVGAPDVPSGDGWAERVAAAVIGKAERVLGVEG